ncbi:uncharacterized protein LOC144102332 [Amblyomma americanum]
MYIEVDDEFATCDLFKRIRKRCVNLEHLHVHALQVKESVALAACKNLVNPDWTLESFAYTSQRFSQIGKWLLVRALELQVPLRYLCVGSAAFGSITYRTKPVFSCTCVHLKYVIALAELSIPEKELIFCVECCPEAPMQLAQVAGRPWLRRQQSLTVVLIPASGRWYFRHRNHYVSPALSSPLNMFLNSCNNLTELNLSLVHFEHGTELCQIFPSEGLSLLRAIALPQCALQTNASLQQLAASCAMLEELDVRSGDGSSSVCLECSVCSLPFTAINRHTFSAFHRGTRLQSLTLLTFYGLGCYRFLAECNLVRLRITWPEKSMNSYPGRSFLAGFSSSEHLRSLTLWSPNVAVSAICNELSTAGVLRLRTLCIVSGVDASGCAQESISELSRRLPLLETVHAHYLDERHSQHRVTWIRCWRLSCPGERKDFEGGAFLSNAPCSSDCAMTTLIGLKKPRH